jgi:hypothetical protein
MSESKSKPMKKLEVQFPPGFNRGRRSPITLRRIPLDPRLEEFCKRVWDTHSPSRRNITKADVYQLYSHYAGGGKVKHSGYYNYLSNLNFSSRSYAVTFQFGKRMVTTPNFNQLMLSYGDGLESKAVPDRLPHEAYALMQLLDPTIGANSSQVVEVFKTQLEGAFFHFARPGPRPAAAERIYLNASATGAVYVFRFVLEAFVNGMPMGIVEAKIIGPAKIGSRPDSIVIYARDKATVSAVIEKLREWIAKPGRDIYFRPETPPMTLPVPGLPGVALGAEPTGPEEYKELPLTVPQYMQQVVDEKTFEFKKIRRETPQEPRYDHDHKQPFVAGPVSFGSLRSDLIAQAFNASREEKESENFEFFLEMVWRYFGAAGLNVLMPHL